MDVERFRKDSKLVKDTKATLIYGPYPKDHPEGIYKISFPNDPNREQIWVNSFEELIEVLVDEIG